MATVEELGVDELDDIAHDLHQRARYPFDASVWMDIQPIEQADAQMNVVKIMYSPEYRIVMNYFRAIVQLKEYSQRAYDLCWKVLHCNPANYVAWRYLKEVILQQKRDELTELRVCEKMMIDHPKSFQIYFFRRDLLRNCHAQALDREKYITQEILQHDSKNYHAWSHRTWFVREFAAYDGEEEFCKEHLLTDIRNNSAWSYMFFLLEHHFLRSAHPAEHLHTLIAKYCIPCIKRVIENECPFQFLVGIAKVCLKGLKNEEERNMFGEALRLIVTEMTKLVRETSGTVESARIHLLGGASEVFYLLKLSLKEAFDKSDTEILAILQQCSRQAQDQFLPQGSPVCVTVLDHIQFCHTARGSCLEALIKSDTVRIKYWKRELTAEELEHSHLNRG